MNTEKLPSYEETTQISEATMTEFISKVERAPNCKSLLSILLSDNGLSPDDKCKAMEKPHTIPAIDEEKDVLWLENTLRLRGSHKLAQSVCYYFHITYALKNRSWCKALIEADIEIRWIVQRMVWVYQQRKTRPSTFEYHLPTLNRKYWRAHTKLWLTIDGVNGYVAERGIAFQRKRIDWYLSRELREDCARRGGCCGRTCGCCERPRRIDGLKTEGMHNRGHCTSACSCCLDAHGLDGNHIGDEITDLQDLHFDTSTIRFPDHHTLRLLKGYVFYIK